jgi:hypothetical protein
MEVVRCKIYAKTLGSEQGCSKGTTSNAGQGQVVAWGSIGRLFSLSIGLNQLHVRRRWFFVFGYLYIYIFKASNLDSFTPPLLHVATLA